VPAQKAAREAGFGGEPSELRSAAPEIQVCFVFWLLGVNEVVLLPGDP